VSDARGLRGAWPGAATRSPPGDARRRLLLAALALISVPLPAVGNDYPSRPEVRAFIDELVAESAVPREWLDQVLASGRYSERVEALMTPSLTPPPRDWRRYRARALDAARLRDAAVYLRRQRATLARAREDFGVPPEIVAAIIGIETHFGRTMGSFRTLDVLLTLAFDYPRRAALYRQELAHFLVLGHDGRLDVFGQTGSFAGAIGLPQFLPGSIRRYALDYDDDGRIDLARSAADAIGSVANYLHQQGWQRERPVMFNATADEAIADELGRGIRAEHRWADVAALGVRIDGYLPPETEVVLLDLPYLRDDGSSGVEYRIGTVNLATILHYNRSYFYGAAVAEFAALLAERRSGEAALSRGGG
jgi:membrane-bound lytic murein transglycosylase B